MTGTVAVSTQPTGAQLTGGFFLNSPAAGLYVKAMTADVENQATCLSVVDLGGGYTMNCTGFQDRQLIVAVIDKSQSNVEKLLALKALGGVSPDTTSMRVDLVLDRDTGTLKTSVSQRNGSAPISLSQIKVSQPQLLKNLNIASGLYDFSKFDVSADAAVRGGNFTGLPDRETRATQGYVEEYFLKFTKSDGFSAPRISLWTDAAKAEGCASGFSMSDGTHLFNPGTITFSNSLAAIVANDWAPKSAIDRYRLAVLDGTSNGGGPTFAAESAHTLVEEFYRRLAASRTEHSPDQRIEDLIRIYAALAQETQTPAGISKGTKTSLARAWARFTDDEDLRRLLNLAVQKFAVSDLLNLGGTGEKFLDSKISNLLTYDQIGYLITVVYGVGTDAADSASLEQHQTFATQWKAINPDGNTAIESALGTAITQMQSSTPSVQETGMATVRSMVHDLDQTGLLVNEICAEELAGNIDFSPIFSSTSGKAAFNALLLDYDLDDGSMTGQATTILQTFIDGVAPSLAGCGKLSLRRQEADALQDDSTAAAYLTTLAPALKTARLHMALYSIDIRNPDGDANALLKLDGTENQSFSEGNAQSDLDALGQQIVDVIKLDRNAEIIPLDYNYEPYFCPALLNVGIDVSSATACTSVSAPEPVQGNVYRKLFYLQSLVSETIAQEAFDVDPIFQATQRSLIGASQCIPDVWVGGEMAADETYPLQIGTPIYQLMDAVVSVVPSATGAKLIADGSVLEPDTTWDPIARSDRACVRGDVKVLKFLDTANASLNSFVLEQGLKDTCYDDSGDPNAYVSAYFTDLTKVP